LSYGVGDIVKAISTQYLGRWIEVKEQSNRATYYIGIVPFWLVRR